MPVTIGEVARQAGFSIATVSHVLNNTRNVAPLTRKSVMAAVRALNYYPNLHARNLAARASNTLGIIVSDIQNPFFCEVIRGFENQARSCGHTVSLANTNYEPGRMKLAVDYLLRQRVRGIALITSEMRQAIVEQILATKTPLAGLDLPIENDLASNIKIDYSEGIREVLNHLSGLGHRRIAFVAGRPDLTSSLARLENFTQTMKALGLKPDWVFSGNLQLDGGLEAGTQILKVPEPITAVVTVNDLTAVGVIKAIRGRGLRVPEDISVTGIDKTFLSQYVDPSLTTVEVDGEHVGRLAAGSLLEICEATRPSGRHYKLQTNLVVRESTGPASAHSRKIPEMAPA